MDAGHGVLRVCIGVILAAISVTFGGHAGVAGRGGHSLPASSHAQAMIEAAPLTQAALSSPAAPQAEQLLAAAPGPNRIRIPRIGVAAPVAALDAGPELTGPSDPAVAGWYARGPAPGEIGPAVIVGHLDSNHGPAVFWRLGQLRPGDEVMVSRPDGSGARFLVRRVARYPRANFPSADVYGPRPAPELRLITCGGAFNFLTRQYPDNVVVYATMA